ncbi:hypothetical protein SNEBB_006175 [Seison nebaliae]|nr:hypothetical protein SNEBB_006175 [Seison nebaliae]
MFHDYDTTTNSNMNEDNMMNTSTNFRHQYFKVMKCLERINREIGDFNMVNRQTVREANDRNFLPLLNHDINSNHDGIDTNDDNMPSTLASSHSGTVAAGAAYSQSNMFTLNQHLKSFRKHLENLLSICQLIAYNQINIDLILPSFYKEIDNQNQNNNNNTISELDSDMIDIDDDDDDDLANSNINNNARINRDDSNPLKKVTMIKKSLKKNRRNSTGVEGRDMGKAIGEQRPVVGPHHRSRYSVLQNDIPVLQLLRFTYSNFWKAPSPPYFTVEDLVKDDTVKSKGNKVVVEKTEKKQAIKTLLRTWPNWDFEIFQLERLSENHPLIHLGMEILTEMNVLELLSCDNGTMQRWLHLIEINYYESNPYHNSTHAADVLQCSAYFLRNYVLRQILSQTEQAVCLLASIAHDVDHPGLTNHFQIHSETPLAIMYNDTSCLESHHAAVMFALTLQNGNVNIFKNLPNTSYRNVRRGVVSAILATDMANHAFYLSEFKRNILGEIHASEPLRYRIKPWFADKKIKAKIREPSNILTICQLLVKCSDISNLCRAKRHCRQWAERIAEEYCREFELSKKNNIKPFSDKYNKETLFLPLNQLEFLTMTIRDLYTSFHRFIDIPEILDHINANYTFWIGEFKTEERLRELQDFRSKWACHDNNFIKFQK